MAPLSMLSARHIPQFADPFVLEEGQTMDSSSVFDVVGQVRVQILLRDAGRKKNFTDNCKPASLPRMKELGVRLEVAENERLIKSSSRKVKQQRMGVISVY